MHASSLLILADVGFDLVSKPSGDSSADGSTDWPTHDGSDDAPGSSSDSCQLQLIFGSSFGFFADFSSPPFPCDPSIIAIGCDNSLVPDREMFNDRGGFGF